MREAFAAAADADGISATLGAGAGTEADGVPGRDAGRGVADVAPEVGRAGSPRRRAG